MNVVDFLSSLRELNGNLRKSEQRVLDSVLKNPEAVSSMRGEELAEKSEVSLPTVTRLCREAGCRNFREFKLRLAQSVAIADYYSTCENSEAESDLIPIAESVVNFAVHSLRKAYAEMDYSSLEQAVDALSGAKRICIFGSGGASSIMSDMMMNRLFRLGFAVNVFHESILAKMAAVSLEEDSVAVAVSATGVSREHIDFLKIAKKKGAQTLSITRRNSALSKASDFALLFDAHEDKSVLKPATARYGYMMLIDILAFALASKNKEKSIKLLKQQHNLVSEHQGDYTKDFLGD